MNHNLVRAQSKSRGSSCHSAKVKPVRHLYVHIPFCARICPYCAFYKELLDRSQTGAFCRALLAELALRTPSPLSHSPKTIYFGGGTPTALPVSQLEFLLDGFHQHLDLSRIAEWTIEANPGSVSPRKAATLVRSGPNRVSLGVQSWDNDLLRLLGREHNAVQAEESFRILRDAGCSNINIDLMFALPGQTPSQWETTLRKTIGLGPEHISTYCLTYEEDTEFLARHTRGEFRSDSDAETDLLEMTMSILQEAGYEHYETSNYARPGFASIHNQAYWSGADYVGIGPSAFSTVGRDRSQNVCDYRAYIERVGAGEVPVAAREYLTDEMKRAERIALLLRTREGIAAKLVRYKFQEVNELVRLGLIRESNGHVVLTDAGKPLADSVAEAFL